MRRRIAAQARYKRAKYAGFSIKLLIENQYQIGNAAQNNPRKLAIMPERLAKRAEAQGVFVAYFSQKMLEKPALK